MNYYQEDPEELKLTELSNSLSQLNSIIARDR